ncbi:MAG: lysostaphin resistance A-like protein [Coriobacteriia bacterium]
MSPDEPRLHLVPPPENTDGDGPEGAPPPSRAWPLGSAFTVVVAAVAATVFGSLAVAFVLTRGWPATLAAFAIGVLLFITYALYFVAAGMSARRRGFDLRTAVGLIPVSRPKSWLGAAFGVAVAAQLFAVLFGILWQMLGFELSGSADQITRLVPPGLAGDIMAMLAVGVFAPAAEEIVFRGVLLNAIRGRWGAWAGILGSSVLFALVHLSAEQFVPILVVAVLLGWLYVRSGSLWVSMAAHSAFNLIALTAVFLTRSGLF